MAGRIVEYAVVYAESGRNFANHVTLYLAEGWELYGELKMSAVYGSRSHDPGDEVTQTFAQALVRRAPESG